MAVWDVPMSAKGLTGKGVTVLGLRVGYLVTGALLGVAEGSAVAFECSLGGRGFRETLREGGRGLRETLREVARWTQSERKRPSMSFMVARFRITVERTRGSL
jgi:hypothetical protein